MEDTYSKFKKLMGFMESSGGKNVDHDKITSGLHAGDTAYGEYGMMPNTAKEMANRRLLRGEGDRQDEQLQNLSNDVVQSVFVAHPDLEDRYVDELVKKSVDTSGGDMVDAAYRWRWGHNLPNEKLEDIKAKNPEYFNRIKQFMNKGDK